VNSKTSSTYKLLGLLSLLLIVGILTRLLLLSRDQFWMDEAYSAIISAWPFWRIADEIPGLGSPPFYNFLLHFWMKIFGNSEFAVRMPSVLFGVLFILFIYKVGKEWFNKNVGILAAAIVVLNTLHIFHSQQARPYSILIFFSLLSSFYLYQFLNLKKMLYWWGYTLSLLLLLYTHNWALFLIPFPYVFLILNRDLWRLFPKLILSHVVVFLGYLPFLPSLFAQSSSGSSSWVFYFWERLGPQWVFLKTFETFFSGGEFMTFGKIPYGRILPCLFLVLLVTYAFLPQRWLPQPFGAPGNNREKNPSQESNFSFKFLLCYLLVPLLLPYVFSFYRPIYISGRYDVIVFGAFCLLLAVGFSKMNKKVFIPAISLFLILMTINLSCYYLLRPPRQENRLMAQLLKEKAKPKDLLLFTGLTRTPIQYYLGKDFLKFNIACFPLHSENNFGYFDYPFFLSKRDLILFLFSLVYSLPFTYINF